ncbi:MAG: DNA double-strand break repair nuclease NurA [Candidatus Ranarchaeia archaeon]
MPLNIIKQDALETILQADAGRLPLEDSFNPPILTEQASQYIAEVLTSLRQSTADDILDDRVRALFTSLIGIGGVEEKCGSPYKTLRKALCRIDFPRLVHDYVEDRGQSLDKASEVLETIDHNKVEPLEDPVVTPLQIQNPTRVLAGLNIVAFDGGSLPIYNYSCSTVYARGGSFGYSQREKEPRLSFESGVNRIWCDAAINVASRPDIFNEEIRRWHLDRIADDTTGEISLVDRVKQAELYLLSLVEAASVALCLRDYAEAIDLIVLDGPLFFGHEGFDASYTRMHLLWNTRKPCYSVIKNPSGSPVMRACGVKDTSDVAFFEYLEPGERSPMFLRHEDALPVVSKPELKRVFWYSKTDRGNLCRYETPWWCYKKGKLAFDKIAAADSTLNGGKISFFLNRVDALVRIRRNFRTMLTALQRASFQSHGIRFTEPYNQIRWGTG